MIDVTEPAEASLLGVNETTPSKEPDNPDGNESELAQNVIKFINRSWSLDERYPPPYGRNERIGTPLSVARQEYDDQDKEPVLTSQGIVEQIGCKNGIFYIIGGGSFKHALKFPDGHTGFIIPDNTIRLVDKDDEVLITGMMACSAFIVDFAQIDGAPERLVAHIPSLYNQLPAFLLHIQNDGKTTRKSERIIVLRNAFHHPSASELEMQAFLRQETGLQNILVTDIHPENLPLPANQGKQAYPEILVKGENFSCYYSWEHNNQADLNTEVKANTRSLPTL